MHRSLDLCIHKDINAYTFILFSISNTYTHILTYTERAIITWNQQITGMHRSLDLWAKNTLGAECLNLHVRDGQRVYIKIHTLTTPWPHVPADGTSEHEVLCVCMYACMHVCVCQLTAHRSMTYVLCTCMYVCMHVFAG